MIFFSVIREKVNRFSSPEITQCTTWFLLSGQRWVRLCHYGLCVCASVCKCVQGVSWEAITRAKIWLVFLTTSFGVAASSETHLPWTFTLSYTTEKDREREMHFPPVKLAPGYLPFDPCSVNVSHHCMFKFCSPPTHVPLVNSFVCVCVCVFRQRLNHYYHNGFST